VPKNIDNKIISNCTTHFYGKMNAPATIEAVRELMAAKGGGGSDIGSLRRESSISPPKECPRQRRLRRHFA